MKRNGFLDEIKRKFEIFPAVALLGPRQVGKTTLAKQFADTQKVFPYKTNYFDLEDPTALLRLENPKLTLTALDGLIVIDEIQLRPNLFPILRYLIDENKNLRFLILGSASRDLIRQSSETLAGRISYLEITPFSLSEKLNLDTDMLWLRGGYPKSILSSSNDYAFEWLEAYTKTFLERDIPALGIQIPASALRRFWTILSHNHGNLLNTSELARSFGAADTTIKRYIDILQGTFMIRSLQPYFTNIKKRQVKSPKIYFRDTGILHYFLNIKSTEDLLTNIKLGASWEGFALEQAIQSINAKPENCFFWRTHQGDEIDLIIEKNNKLYGFEFKYSDQPKITKSMKTAISELELEKLIIVTPQAIKTQLHDKIWLSGLEELLKNIF